MNAIYDSDCVCGGGNYGHRNDVGGYCCPHYGNTCGFHDHYTNEEWVFLRDDENPPADAVLKGRSE